MVKAKKGFNLFWTVLLSVASVLYVYPILMILLNSFKRRPPSVLLRRSCRPRQIPLPARQTTSTPFLPRAFYRVSGTARSSPSPAWHSSCCAVPCARGTSPASILSDEQGHVLSVCVQHGGAVPDGDVHTFPDGGQSGPEQALQHCHHLRASARGWRCSCSAVLSKASRWRSKRLP